MTGVDRSHLPEVGPDPPFRFPAIVRHRLPNGLRVWTVEHHGAPVVTFALQIDGGSAADPPGREGIAALTADMVDEGSGERTALDIAEALARLGADYDVEVGADATVFSLTTLARLAEPGATLLAEMVLRPSLRKPDFERVRQQRLSRLRQLKDMPATVADRAFLRLVYADHPYGHLSIGREASLGTLALDELAAFHARTFTPGRSTLVVCGALEHGRLLACADAAFGGWSAEAGAPSKKASDREPTAAPHHPLTVVPREGAAQSELRIGRLTTGRATSDYPAIVVMNAVLGGQFVSRINLMLREHKGYTYGARTSFDWRCGVSPFVLQTSVDTAATADAIRLSHAEIGALAASRPPSDAEMTLAKASLTRGYPRGFETAQQVARGVAQIALHDLPDDYFASFVPTVNAVTREDVIEAASRYLDASTLTTLVVGDHTAIAASLGELNLGEPRVLEAVE